MSNKAKLSETLFLSGDIGLSTNNGWLARLIRWGQSIWTTDALFSHAFMFVDAVHVVEALAKISYNNAQKYDSQKVLVFRIPLNVEDRDRVRDGIIERVNGAYGWTKYPLFFLDATTTWFKQKVFRQKNPCFFFTKTFGISNIPVCSQLVIWAVHKFTAYRLKDARDNVVDWRIVTPDYLCDLLCLESNNAAVIFKS